jgi:hypothetical protein
VLELNGYDIRIRLSCRAAGDKIEKRVWREQAADWSQCENERLYWHMDAEGHGEGQLDLLERLKPAVHTRDRLTLEDMLHRNTSPSAGRVHSVKWLMATLSALRYGNWLLCPSAVRKNVAEMMIFVEWMLTIHASGRTSCSGIRASWGLESSAAGSQSLPRSGLSGSLVRTSSASSKWWT